MTSNITSLGGGAAGDEVSLEADTVLHPVCGRA
jgi:hypothetical protein